eukprot:751382-Hanusia_phi.AAC.6
MKSTEQISTAPVPESKNAKRPITANKLSPMSVRTRMGSDPSLNLVLRRRRVNARSVQGTAPEKNHVQEGAINSSAQG